MKYISILFLVTVFTGKLISQDSIKIDTELAIEVKGQRIYFNAGEYETPTVTSVEKMRDILINFGMPADNIKVDIEKDEGHWHMTWRKGFKKAYPWIVKNQ